MIFHRPTQDEEQCNHIQKKPVSFLTPPFHLDESARQEKEKKTCTRESDAAIYKTHFGKMGSDPVLAFQEKTGDVQGNVKFDKYWNGLQAAVPDQ